MTAVNTPAKVARHATVLKALDRNSTTLIGVFGPQNNYRALLRGSNGRMHRVAAGKRLGIGRVVGIDATGVTIKKNGRTLRLTMPSD